MASTSARRYAQAIIELAQEEGNFDAWQRDLTELGTLVGDDSAAGFFANPNISDDEKFTVVENVLKDLRPETRNLAKILIDRRKIAIVPDVVALFDEAVLARKGVALVDVTTAETLDDQGQELVRQHLKTMLGKDIQLRLHVDPEIIGGIIARSGDQVIDGSVTNQLRRLRTRLYAA
ncbi:MAG TPA: F0F1 ATP synthase subunit delta [Thermomicrobiales bacterium]|nr:F0F1 ATP synthase subunit delta [Thermomicrobiales bacterium]